MSQTIDKCAKSTAEYDHKLKVFALQFYGECYSGYNGLDAYDDYGSLPYSDTITNNCWAGVGASGINFVYKFEEYEGKGHKLFSIFYCYVPPFLQIRLFII